ncbi:MAG: hypothetical protein BGO01_00205 [Armatimonadetes bacterium 55-13]|nr:DUF2235 domain-containing protein [Armatimonadota bacterium]OJU63123.1 MAG: hypothetical protein BGO01_00205 [Armatimonadetes bacterium 55-13]
MAERNIVLCFDGTSNEVDSYATNVLRLFRCLVKDDGQLCFYDAGVGTLEDPAQLGKITKKLRKGLDLAMGFTLRDNVIEGYNFLVRNYQETDDIYLFGYSRGAYTARAVAGMVHMFGLLRPEHENLTPYLWQRYYNNIVAKGSEDQKKLFATAAVFRRDFSRKNVPIHFVGAFDTVSSFGLLTRYRTLPYTRTNEDIHHFRHACAMDERRAHFPSNQAEAKDPAKQDYKTVWFAGVHSDIGGGRPEEKSALCMVPFQWIVREAVAQGLKVETTTLQKVLEHPKPDPLAPRDESLDWIWRCIGILPLKSWSDEKQGFRLRWPNFSRKRKVPEGATLHQSVIDRVAKGMVPVTMPKSYQVEK